MASKFIKNLLFELLDLTKEFNSVEEIVTSQYYFTLILTGIARRDYPIIHSIGLLIDDPLSGDAILALSRRLFEDMISIEFMLAKGKEKKAIKFIKYSAVERWLDLQYLKNLGVTSDPVLEKQVEEDFLQVKPDFIFKKHPTDSSKDEIAQSWSSVKLELMIEVLIKGNLISVKDTYNLLQGYMMGNRKIHLSSGDVSSFIDKSEREKNINGSSEVGTAIAILCYIRICMIYATETNNTTLGNKLDSLFKKLNVSLDKKE